MKKFFSVMILSAIILLTSVMCFASQNGYWKGNQNYPFIGSYTVAVKNTVQKNYLLQPSNELVIKIETMVIDNNNRGDADAFYYKKFGNYIFFINHNASAGSSVINWKLLDKNNSKHQEALRAYQIADSVLRSK